jgi:hypothetical protein
MALQIKSVSAQLHAPLHVAMVWEDVSYTVMLNLFQHLTFSNGPELRP